MKKINFHHLAKLFSQLKEPPQLSKKLRLIWLGSILVALITGLVIAVVIFNKLENKKLNHLEVTFVDPRQAIVFWTTDAKTKGYIKYGQTAKKLDQIAYQTSSEPNTIHAVLLTDVPLGGVYFTLHTELDSLLFWPKVNQLIFDPTTIN